MASATEIRWDIVEEHLDEAGFLWGQWARGLEDPEYDLALLAEGPEARLWAHLDALVVGGRQVADRLLLPALGSDEPGQVFAAAWALLASEDGDFTAPVVAALKAASPEQAGPLRQAFALGPRTDLLRPLAPLLASGPPPAQAAALEVLAARRIDPGARLDGLFGVPDGAVRRAALRLARVMPERVTPEAVERLLSAADPEERQLAIEAGLVLGVKAAWPACAAAVRARGQGCWGGAALVYALSGERDLGPLTAALAEPALRAEAIYALGFTGLPAAVEAVVPWLEDERFAPVAAEALSAVTGLAIAGKYAVGGKVWDPEAPEEDAPAGGEAAADLPVPEVDDVLTWWRGNRERLDPAARLLGGRPWGVEALLEALAAGTMRRRHALAFDLAVRTRGQHQLETRAAAARQLAEVASLRGAPPRLGTKTYREIVATPAPRVAAPKAGEGLRPPGGTVTGAARSASGLAVTAIGLATSLGDGHLPAVAASIAGISRIGPSTEYEVFDGDEASASPARVHDVEDVRGYEGHARLVMLAERALGGLLCRDPGLPGRRLGLIVNLPSAQLLHMAARSMARPANVTEAAAGSRPEPDEEWTERATTFRERARAHFLPRLLQVTSLLPAVQEAMFGDGPGFGPALERARAMLLSGQVDACLVGGIDSLVEPLQLEALESLRLLRTPDLATGAFPGEAAVFLLVERPESARRERRRVLLQVEAIASHVEPQAPEGAAPRGLALAEAVRAALGQQPGSAPCLVLGGLNGTTARASDWGSALVRLGPLLADQREVQPAVAFGETGAAAGFLAIAVAAGMLERRAVASPGVLVWAWGEAGGRTAAYLRSGEP